MPEHYYTSEPSSKSRPTTFQADILGRSFTFTTDAGVFSRDGVDPGTRLLIESIVALRGRVLDLGCGWGALSVPLAWRYAEAQFVLCDVNRRSLALAEKNLRDNAIRNAQTVESDGFARVDGTFDAILTNPPIRAGKQVLYRLFRESWERLNPGGELRLVIRKQQGADSAKRYLETLSPLTRTVARSGGYHVLSVKRKEQSDENETVGAGL